MAIVPLALRFELHDEAKRHSNIGPERVRDDICMVAEAVVTLFRRVDALRPWTNPRCTPTAARH